MAAGLTLTTNPTTLTNPIAFSGTAVYGPTGTAWTVTNQTDISGAGGSGIGIQLEAGGAVTNQAGASIIGGNRAMNIYGGPGTVTNSGFIDGIGSAAIVFNGSAPGVITNLGTITNGNGLAAFTIAMTDGGSLTNGASGSTAALIGGGGIIMDGVSTVTNFGTITDLTPDAILFGTAGANRFIDEPGSQIIAASGGPAVQSVGGSSVIELAGTAPGTINGIGTNYKGFQTVQFDTGAEWSVGVSSGGPYPNFTGFAHDDSLTLAGVTADSATYSGGVLTLMQGGTTVLNLNLTTPVSNPMFVVSSNAGSTTVVIDRPPTQATHTVRVNESASTGTVSAGDSDPDGDSITVTGVTGGTIGAPLAGTYGTLTLNANDTYNYTANDTNAINAAPSGNLTDSFTYTVSDGQGGTTTETLNFSIQRPPQVTPTSVDEWILINGQWAVSAQPGSIPSGYQVAGTGDFTGNGTSDILWQNAGTGDAQEWLINNGAWAGTVDLGTHPGNYQIAGIGDFFGNGIDDILWTSVNGNGTVATDIWQLSSSGQWMASDSPGAQLAGYKVVAVGDFTGNGTSDILWQNPTTGDVDEWQIINGGFASFDLGSHPGSGWTIAGVGDFTGNDIDDILWTNPNGPNGDTQVDIWELGSNGQWAASVSPGLGLHPSGYQVAAIGNFSGNGTDGVLWHDPTNGDVDEWVLGNNAQWAKSVDLGSHPGSFQIAGTGNFVAGNSASDILWQAHA